MDPDRWTQIKEIFDAATRCESNRRTVLLDRSCGGDAELRAAVESLLGATDAPPGFLEPPIEGGAVNLAVEAAQILPVGRRIGPYEVTGVIASGGMGTVYRGVRADGAFDREVAVKVIKPGMATEDMLRRFRREQQALADLDHPYIARLLDGGTTDGEPDGDPYLVMEYIDGVPINRYCDEHGLSVAERLALFRNVCSAVHYAHQNLLVHRDLKPTNILVTQSGEPKLLDFGIAKLLSGRTGDRATDPTRTGPPLMTPQYASPEQVRGDPVTTAGDVYSLGVILYELLTGHLPYDLTDKRPGEVERIITEFAPDPPSTTVSRSASDHGPARSKPGAPPVDVMATHRLSPERLCRSLRGDLDRLVLAAMHKDPARRYASAEQLSDDIRCFLEGLPVRAQRDTLEYRTRKFIQRHKAGVAVATFVILSLVLGFGLATAGFISARAAREEALNQAARVKVEAERARFEADKAREARLQAERVSGFLQGMLTVADLRDKQSDLTVRDMLDKAASRVDTELAAETEVRAAIHATIGRSYYAMGLFPQAETHLGAAHKAYLEASAADPKTIAPILRELGNAVSANGHYAQAETLLREALSLSETIRGDRRLDVAKVEESLAAVLFLEGELPEAQALAQKSLDTMIAIHTTQHEDVAEAMDTLSSVHLKKGTFQEAEDLSRQALSIRRAILDSDHPAIPAGLNNLALVLELKGEFTQALALHREALDLLRIRLGDEHPFVAYSLTNQAGVLAALGDNDEAAARYREALRIFRVVDDPRAAQAAGGLGALMSNIGDYETAETLQREALAVRREHLGNSHFYVAKSLLELGKLMHLKGDFPAAETYLREALGIVRSNRGDDHWTVAVCLETLATVIADRGDPSAAEVMIHQALEIQRRSSAPEHPRIGKFLGSLGAILLQRGQLAAAESELTKSLQILRGALPVGHWRIALVKSSLGECLVRQERFDEAEPLLLESLPMLRESRGTSSTAYRRTLTRIIDLYDAWNKPDEAAEYRSTSKAGGGCE
ncbi:MAG: serine/threonine protein kinase [Planctomycetes bacterium]|nr:serine/threonine protein kinase [Planctomycetota bacterium]